MEIRLTITDPTPEALEGLRDFLHQHRDSVAAETEARWTVESARAYVLRLPPVAKQIIEALAAHDLDGVRTADEIRAVTRLTNLRGCTGAFKRKLSEGAVAGLWSPGLPVPVKSITSGNQIQAFQITASPQHPDLLDIFKAATKPLRPPR